MPQPWFRLPFGHFLCMCVCRCVCAMSMFLCHAYPSICMHISVFTSVDLHHLAMPVHLFIHPSIYLSTYLSREEREQDLCLVNCGGSDSLVCFVLFFFSVFSIFHIGHGLLCYLFRNYEPLQLLRLGVWMSKRSPGNRGRDGRSSRWKMRAAGPLDPCGSCFDYRCRARPVGGLGSGLRPLCYISPVSWPCSWR